MKPVKIRLKQRWQFKTGSGRDSVKYIAEVVSHPNGSPTAGLEVKQVIKKGWSYTYKTQLLDGIFLLTDSNWTYLEGQDRP